MSTDLVTILQPPAQLTTTLVPPVDRVTMLTAGQGPAGVGASPAVMTAGEALNAGDYVYFDSTGHVHKADNRYESKACMGWVSAAATTGHPVTVNFVGINDNNAGLTPGPVWLGTNGQLTQVAPSTGALVQTLGYATSSSAVNFIVGLIVVLAGTQP